MSFFINSDSHIHLDILGMGYTLTMTEEEALGIGDICEVARWEDEGGASL